MAALQPTSAGKRGPKLRNTWQRRSSTQQGGEARGHGTCGSTGAHLGRQARSRAAGHMEVPELTSIERRGLELQGTWQRVDARPAPYLDLKLVCGVPGLQGTDRGPRAHLGRGSEPTGGANSSVPHRVILNLLLDNYLSRSLAAQGPEKNLLLKKYPAHRGPLEALLEIEERLPLSCGTSTVGPLRSGAGAEDPRAPTINARKRRRQAPWEAVSELEVRERPPSTL
jgi:hypothetical protein